MGIGLGIMSVGVIPGMGIGLPMTGGYEIPGAEFIGVWLPPHEGQSGPDGSR